MTGRAARRTAGPGRHTRAQDSLRPTSSRVRTALFDSLGALVAGMRVLDLFAGTGGLGIEALVRGARRVVFVEDHPAQCHAIQRALQRLEFAFLAQVRCEDVLAALRRIGSTGETFDLALLDPPYGQGWIDRTLEAIRESGTLLTNALVVAEGHWRDRPELVPGFMLVKEARYGETALWYIRIEGVS